MFASILLTIFWGISCCVYSFVPHFVHLQDSRLCNNGNLPRYNESLCKQPNEQDAGAGYVCDTRVIAPDDCREVAVEMEMFTHAKLLEMVPTVDRDSSLRRIVVKIDEAKIDIDQVGKEIDRFLTQRPWWYAHKEPFHWNKHSHRVIVLDRVQHEFEHSLRELAAMQYPYSEDVCAKSVLLFNHKDFYHPGWYSMLVVFAIVHSELPYAITAMYVSSQNSVNDSAAFITGSDCPDVVNKWECAFLPATNCELPTAITECKGHNCVQNVVPDTRWSTAIFDSATKTGNLLKPDTPDFAAAKERSSHPPNYNPHYLAEAQLPKKYGNAHVKYLKPYYPALAPFQSMMHVDMDMYTYKFLLRPSSFYRSRIAEAIREFHAQHNLTAESRCVAAQVRRGDRAMAGVNITEFCLRPENFHSDMGCADVPFASVTLQHVVDSAAKLVEPGVRNLIVTTDDEEWLEKQKLELRKTRPEWNVYNLKAPSRSATPAQGVGASYDFMRYGAGTASGVLLHGSIELSRQCEAFVGHFGCGGTMIVYKSLCAQHNHREYVCPPSFDVRTIEELRIPHPHR